MKRQMNILIITIFCLLFIGPSTTHAQRKHITNLEKFSAKKGRLKVVESYLLGFVVCKRLVTWAPEERLMFRAEVIYVPGQKVEQTGGIEITMQKKTERYSDVAKSFSDIDEAMGLSEAILYMSNLMSKWEKEVERPFITVTFSTGDRHFNLVFQQSKLEKNEKEPRQSTYASFGALDAGFCSFESKKKLMEVKALVDKGLKLIKE